MSNNTNEVKLYYQMLQTILLTQAINLRVIHFKNDKKKIVQPNMLEINENFKKQDF